MFKFTNIIFWSLIGLSLGACQKSNTQPNPASGQVDDQTKAPAKITSYLTGDAADVNTTTTGGAVLMGGSTDVDEAFRWMIQKSGGGDFVIIRASGADGYNPYIYTDLGGVNSVETFILDSRTKAQDAAVAQKIRNAEALFIAGGDQANYVNYWKDTPVEDAVNYLINTKKVPVGGTSAGCAIMGQQYFGALNGSVTTSQALTDPYNRYMTIGSSDFISQPFLTNTITDTHYNNPDRKGRHFAFLARMTKDWNLNAKGIGVEERTAVLIDQNGLAKVVGSAKAYFLQRYNNSTPEQCVSKKTLTWNNNQQAVRVYEIQASGTVATASASIDLSNWATVNGGVWKFMSSNNGVFSY
ncbi:MAG: cyanophycinase [Microscillaceae bacterium]|jgi:cyanophycinase|nr:cyanophycinase [Microscillaceae bacterium]